MKNRRAFVILDMIIGFALLAFLGTLFAIALSKMHRTSDRLAEDRAMFRDAESAMLDLQMGKKIENDEIKMARVEGNAPAGRAWVELTIARDGRHADLIGLVPQSALAERVSP